MIEGAAAKMFSTHREPAVGVIIPIQFVCSIKEKDSRHAEKNTPYKKMLFSDSTSEKCRLDRSGPIPQSRFLSVVLPNPTRLNSSSHQFPFSIKALLRFSISITQKPF